MDAQASRPLTLDRLSPRISDCGSYPGEARGGPLVIAHTSAGASLPACNSGRDSLRLASEAALSTSPFLSVVIPAFNVEDTIERCIESVQRQNWPETAIEIVVVDNGSTDRTKMRAERTGCRLIEEGRRGRSSARNRGVQAAQGDLLAFLDADCEAPPEWLPRCLELMSKPFMGAVQARVRKHGQAAPSATFVQAHYYLPFLDTCAMVTHRTAFESAGGFDEELRRNVDMDFSFRLLASGYALGWMPDVVVVKHHDLSFRQHVRRGWDGGVSAALLNLKWQPRVQKAATTLYLDRVKLWLRTSAQAIASGSDDSGKKITEETAKFAGWLATYGRRPAVAEAPFVGPTALEKALGDNCYLVLDLEGGLLFDAKRQKVQRLSLPEIAALKLDSALCGQDLAQARAS